MYAVSVCRCDLWTPSCTQSVWRWLRSRWRRSRRSSRARRCYGCSRSMQLTDKHTVHRSETHTQAHASNAVNVLCCNFQTLRDSSLLKQLYHSPQQQQLYVNTHGVAGVIRTHFNFVHILFMSSRYCPPPPQPTTPRSSSQLPHWPSTRTITSLWWPWAHLSTPALCPRPDRTWILLCR